MNINKKDIIRINQEADESGEFGNESSLDFALGIIRQEKSWLYELSYLVRSIIVDHVFKDGNKRTAFLLVIGYFEDKNIDCNKDIVYKAVYDTSRKNIKDINRIMRMIKNAME